MSESTPILTTRRTAELRTLAVVVTDNTTRGEPEVGKIVVSDNVSLTESSRTRPATRASAAAAGSA
jgi:hypothetical protein